MDGTRQREPIVRGVRSLAMQRTIMLESAFPDGGGARFDDTIWGGIRAEAGVVDFSALGANRESASGETEESDAGGTGDPQARP